MFQSIVRSAVVLLSVLVLSGCAITDEFRRQGGFADHVFDKIIPADSRQHRVFRSYLIVGILARVASESPVNLDDREAVAGRIEKAVQASREALGCARDPACAFLDDRIAMLDRRLFNLAVAVLYPEETRDLLARMRQAIQGDIPIVGRTLVAAKAAVELVGEAGGAVNDLAGVINSLLDLSVTAYRYSNRLGPLYRDTIGLDMRIFIASMEKACLKRGQLADRACDLNVRAVEMYKDGAGSIAEWSRFLRHDVTDVTWLMVPEPKHWIEASDLIWRGCDLLVGEAKKREKCRAEKALLFADETQDMRKARDTLR
jgi:hypothetical protein